MAGPRVLMPLNRCMLRADRRKTVEESKSERLQQRETNIQTKLAERKMTPEERKKASKEKKKVPFELIAITARSVHSVMHSLQP